mmetsp:Transcript_61147/g.173703  ORF Transcript_61147/g.173703 Transcript_61147/m.173703 type:complete len:213 (+) Transcript_61147:229-867(+)
MLADESSVRLRRPVLRPPGSSRYFSRSESSAYFRQKDSRCLSSTRCHSFCIESNRAFLMAKNSRLLACSVIRASTSLWMANLIRDHSPHCLRMDFTASIWLALVRASRNSRISCEAPRSVAQARWHLGASSDLALPGCLAAENVSRTLRKPVLRRRIGRAARSLGSAPSLASRPRPKSCSSAQSPRMLWRRRAMSFVRCWSRCLRTLSRWVW